MLELENERGVKPSVGSEATKERVVIVMSNGKRV